MVVKTYCNSQNSCYTDTIPDELDMSSSLQSFPLKEKTSQPSTKKIWDEKRGKEVYLTWHKNLRRSIDSPSTPTSVNSTLFRKGYLDRVWFEYPSEFYRGKLILEGTLFANEALKMHQSLLDESYVQYNDRELLTMARSKANAHTFDLGTFIGELPETIRFGGALVIRIINAIAGLRFKNLAPPSKRVIKRRYLDRVTLENSVDGVDASADAWLAYRYAVLPLVYSLQDAVKALEPPSPVFKRDRFRDSSELTLETSVSSRIHSDLKVQTLGAVQHVARVEAYTMLSAADVRKRRVLLDLATTAWELVPLSFVVDWVIQVGDFLSALREPPCQSQGFTVSHKYKIDIETSYVGSSYDVQWGSGWDYNRETRSYEFGDPLRLSERSYKRAVFDSNLPIIPVANRINFVRSVDAFALIFKGTRNKLYKGMV